MNLSDYPKIAPPSPPKPWAERNPVFAGFLGVALGGLLSVASSFIAADMTSTAQLHAAQAQLTQEKELKTQEQRDTTYQAYLSAAGDYRAASTALFGRRAPKNVNEAVSSFAKARSKYQAQINEVYVYGSDEALRAHEKIARTMPPSLGDGDLNVKASDLSDEKTYMEAYNGFLKVRCKEVAATTRPGCAS